MWNSAHELTIELPLFLGWLLKTRRDCARRPGRFEWRWATIDDEELDLLLKREELRLQFIVVLVFRHEVK
jgi:hypothetical protein